MKKMLYALDCWLDLMIYYMDYNEENKIEHGLESMILE